jgi:hypothetical protein
MADYYCIVAQAVIRLPSNADEARHAIYQRARTALRETLATLEPAVSAHAEAALEAAIAKIEMDLLLSIMRRFVREEAGLSPTSLSFAAKIKAFIRALTANYIALSAWLSRSRIKLGRLARPKQRANSTAVASL